MAATATLAGRAFPKTEVSIGPPQSSKAGGIYPSSVDTPLSGA